MNSLIATLAKTQQMRFLAVGAVNTAIGYGIFCAIYALTSHHWSYLTIAISSHLIAVSIAYQTQRRFVFGSHCGWWTGFLRFNLSQCLTFLMGLGLLTTLVEWAGLHPLPAQALATVVTVCLSFVLHRSFSFRSGRR
jgi:putative flippase GtrA